MYVKLVEFYVLLQITTLKNIAFTDEESSYEWWVQKKKKEKKLFFTSKIKFSKKEKVCDEFFEDIME